MTYMWSPTSCVQQYDQNQCLFLVRLVSCEILLYNVNIIKFIRCLLYKYYRYVILQDYKYYCTISPSQHLSFQYQYETGTVLQYSSTRHRIAYCIVLY